MRRSVALLCLTLCLLALWLMWMAFQPKTTTAGSVIDAAPKPSLTPSSPPKLPKAQAVRQPLKISSKGTLRLKPGESAVLGYWEIAPGMNGMAIVTPETTPEGHVKMAAELVQMSDAAVSNTDAQDLLPDIFDFENYSAITPGRLRELQDSLQSTRGADMLTTPTVLTLPGQQASISIGQGGGSSLSLGLRASPVVEDGGYDLSIELQRQE